MPVRVFQGETASLRQQTGHQRVLWLSLDPCLDAVQEHLRRQHERLGLGDISVTQHALGPLTSRYSSLFFTDSEPQSKQGLCCVSGEAKRANVVVHQTVLS